MKSANQGRDTIAKLVYESEVADLTEYGASEGDETIIYYRDGSVNAWISSTGDVDLDGNTERQLEGLLESG